MLAGQAPSGSASGSSTALSAAQRELISVASELIIPTTDTPGAIAAGVPDFIEMMLSDWFEEDERQAFLDGLTSLEAQSQARAGADFVDVETDLQITILTEMEEATTEQLRGPLFLRRQPAESFVLSLKELTLVGYYSSEIGASQELRWAAIPGYFDGNADLAALGRASSGW